MLGPLEVAAGSQRIEIAAGRQRALLILLALHANRHLSAQVLLDELWHGVPPGNGHRAVHVLVSRLRRSLAVPGEPEQIVSANHGYLLRATPDQLDVLRFECLVEEGRGRLAAGDARSALVRLDDALALWRGEALADAAYEPFAQSEIRRLDELRLLAEEERLEALLGVGDHARAVADATALVNDQRMRMRSRRLLALALYRSGRHADALAVLREARLVLDTAGLEPDAALRGLETSILTQDDTLAAPTAESAPAVVIEPPPEQRDGSASDGEQAVSGRPTRKTVTVLCCDLADSAAISADAERVGDVLATYVDRVRGVVDHHGGTVERSVADAVMAVFGVPVLHEDDAQRAVRAAIAIRAAVTDLGLASRIGVMTGEVVAGPDGSVVGEVVTVTARLAQAASPREVLIGETTRRLVASIADVEPLVDRAAPHLQAVRLVAARAAGTAAPASPFVGRGRELDLIRSAWMRAVSTGRCDLITIVGEPGIGKSRLVGHALESVDAPAVTGVCLPYGDGITYWAVVRILRQLAITPRDAAAAEAVASLLDERAAVRSADDVAWGVRRVLEQAAESGPIAVVIDDVQWAEPTLLDLIESLALMASGPLLVVCIARPEMVERRPGWPVTLAVAPLTADDADELVPADLPADLRSAVMTAANGNPLFIEQLVAASASCRLTASPTLDALLAARVDQLAADERRMLLCGAVEGELFHLGAARALVDDDQPVTPRLAALVRRGLLRPDRPEIAGEDAFRFRHLLLRDAAYAALPKTERSDLHRRFATWLDQHATGSDHDAVIGYHQEQAHRYRTELGLSRDDALADAGAQRLAASGRRAHLRADFGAARSLLERALDLHAPDDIDVPLELDLIDVLYWSGDAPAALERAERLAARTEAAGDRTAALTGALKAALVRSWVDPTASTDVLRELLEAAMPQLEAAGDRVGLYTAWMARADLAFARAQADAALVAYQEAARHVAAPNATLLEWQAACRFWGTTPAGDILAWLDATADAGEGGGWQAGFRVYALGMLGRFDEARAVIRAERAGRGSQLRGIRLATALAHEAEFELVVGNIETAVELLTECCRLLEDAGEFAILSTRIATLAIALCDLGRYDEAAVKAARAGELCPPGDVFTELSFLLATARVTAYRGELTEAEALARRAATLAGMTSALDAQAAAAADLGEVLYAQGRTADAVEALTRAAQLYDEKGNVAVARRVRGRLAQLATASAPDRAAGC